VSYKNLLAFDGSDFSVLYPCEAKSYHGFMGFDTKIVSAIAWWIKGALDPKGNGYRWFSFRNNMALEIGVKDLARPPERMQEIHARRNPHYKRKRGKMKDNSSKLLAIILGLIFLSLVIFVQDVLSQSKKSFLWRVQSKTNTVYILGSIHFLKKKMYPLNEKIERAFERSDILVVEATINDIKKEDIQKLIGKVFYQGDDLLEKHVSTETFELLKNELDSLNLPIEIVNKQRPWFLALTLASLETLKLGFDPNYGIDKYFLSKAKEKKRIMELESFDYQINLFSQLSEKDQELLLLYALKDIHMFKQDKQELDKLIEAWTSGDTKGVESTLTRSLSEDGRLVPIYEKLVYERNRKMASKIEDFVQAKETYFVIVGAGHLVGNRGIIEILKEKGHLLEQL
jgi:uncharacterized protein YbaP (TraB family)